MANLIKSKSVYLKHQYHTVRMYRQYKNGGEYYWMYCDTCGKHVKQVPILVWSFFHNHIQEPTVLWKLSRMYDSKEFEVLCQMDENYEEVMEYEQFLEELNKKYREIFSNPDLDSTMKEIRWAEYLDDLAKTDPRLAQAEHTFSMIQNDYYVQ